MAEFSTTDIASIRSPEMDTLKWDELRILAFQFAYDQERDTLFLREEPKRAAVSLPMGQDAWVRYDPQTLEIVGVEVEDFEKVFLVHHPELRATWERVRPHVTKRRSRHSEDTMERSSSLIREVLEWLGNPQSGGPPTVRPLVH